jgi:hypothetical protein
MAEERAPLYGCNKKGKTPMADEMRFRALLERAQESTEHIKSFLGAVTGDLKGDAPELKSLAVKTRQQLQDVQEGLDRIWDVFKRG